MEEAHTTRIAVEREILALDLEGIEMGRFECLEEREMRHEERPAPDKLDLEKFRLMIEMFRKRK